MIDFMVDEKTAGQRADRALRVVAPGVDRAMSMRLLRDGAISVNNGVATLKSVLKHGDRVTARIDPALLQPRKEKPVAAKTETRRAREFKNVTVIYVDAHIMVVDKPAGMATHPADGVEEGSTLVDVMKAYLKKERITTERPPAAAGRLDRGTSGLLIMTLSRDGEKGMAKVMEDDQVEKEYLALVHGVTQPKFEIDEPITVSKYKRGQPKNTKVKSALTKFERVAHAKEACLVRCFPMTGRMHQIRRHLREARHPIIGDGRYGTREDRHAEQFFLHADKLVFPHPVDGKKLTFNAALPAEFREAMKKHGVKP